MKILFVASEVVPFAKTGGLADVAGALPLALEELGQEVRIVMPYYRVVSQLASSPVASLNKDISYTKIGKDIVVYFIKNDKYFNRDGLYGDKHGDYPDNLERFSYFSKKSSELIKEINYKPDVIHCNDWQTALIPVYLKNLYYLDDFYKNIKTVLTIHNLGYQGLFPKNEYPKLGLDWSLFNMEELEFYDKINILKGGLVFSDLINTVSPTYAKEIQSKEQGFGLEGLLEKRKDCLFGILNGLDYKLWDPLLDKFIFKNYSLDNPKDKYINKQELQKLCGLPQKDIPLFGMVGRLAAQKGLDILSENLEEITNLDIQLVILGTGDIKYHQILEEIAKRYPKVVRVFIKFDDPLAHKIYAGSDIFLMPSHYEPCGLGQLISFKYGTIPLVYKTGGLADTVTPDNGFVFTNYTPEDLLGAVKKAVALYKDKKSWMKLVKKVMQYDFSWEESAKKYIELYKKIIDSSK